MWFAAVKNRDLSKNQKQKACWFLGSTLGKLPILGPLLIKLKLRIAFILIFTMGALEKLKCNQL